MLNDKSIKMINGVGAKREQRGPDSFNLMRHGSFMGPRGKNNRNKGKQMKSEWWSFLFPSYHVYIEELIHSQKWKVMGEKNTSFYLPLPS